MTNPDGTILTKREFFAAWALQGLLVSCSDYYVAPEKIDQHLAALSNVAVRAADTLIVALNKEKKTS